MEALNGNPVPAYSTVLTTLRILEKKGYLGHGKEGRAYVYYPVVDHGHVRRKTVQYLISRFFDNSPELLVLNILGNEGIDHKELRRLKKMIEKSK